MSYLGRKAAGPWAGFVASRRSSKSRLILTHPRYNPPPTMTLPNGGPVTQTPTYRAARPQVVGADTPQKPFPIYLSGAVQKGFGRGGKDLGCPTGWSNLHVNDTPQLTSGG